MITEIFAGDWKKLSGEIKKQWGKLTDDELTEIGGYKDKLLGILEKKYGYAKKEAEEEIQEFMDKHDIKYQELKERAINAVKQVSEEVEEYVHTSPLRSLAVAAGAGLILGFIFSR